MLPVPPLSPQPRTPGRPVAPEAMELGKRGTRAAAVWHVLARLGGRAGAQVCDTHAASTAKFAKPESVLGFGHPCHLHRGGVAVRLYLRYSPCSASVSQALPMHRVCVSSTAHAVGPYLRHCQCSVLLYLRQSPCSASVPQALPMHSSLGNTHSEEGGGVAQLRHISFLVSQ